MTRFTIYDSRFTIYDSRFHNLRFTLIGVFMPNPKRRHSKARRGKRRAHDALRVPQATLCPNCQEPRMQHRVCPKCGHYKGREILHVEQT
ncbi:MAG TPA: 50S ribosomal protein L32 [Pyrinomonadaceae bacterium]|nr:50S ribosomal protein L32 [Pyrinomonadaceae bacterium]